MSKSELTPELLALLQRVDTPSVCNAIEVAQGQRGFRDFTRGTMISSEPKAEAIVGYARTARIAALHPPDEPSDIIRQRRLDYFRHMAEGPSPTIAVVEDLDYPNCVGAWWGEVHTAVHKGLGMKGALTNGAMRDLGDLAPDFPVIAGSIGPSHAYVHVKSLATSVSVFGLTIKDNDLVHADRHGAVVIPPEVLGDLEDAIEKMFAAEQLILEPARSESFDIDALLKAWKAFEKSRT